MHTLPLALFPLLLLPPPAADGWLGIYLSDQEDAAVVAEVIPDSPAHKAGLLAGDVLLAVGDVATPDAESFVAAIRKGKAGDRITIKLRRGEREQTVVVTLGNRPDAPGATATARPPAGSASTRARGEPPAPASESKPTKPPGAAEAPPVASDKAKEPASKERAAKEPGYLGVSVREVEGRVVVERVLPDGPAKELLRAGDRIEAIDGAPLKSLADLDKALAGKSAGSELALSIGRGEGATKASLSLGSRPGRGPAVATATVPAIEAQPVPARQRSGEMPRATAKDSKPEQQARIGVPLPPAAPRPAVPPSEPPPAPPSARTSPVPPAPAPATAPASGDPAHEAFVAELQALRAELAELRRQLEELRQRRGGK